MKTIKSSLLLLLLTFIFTLTFQGCSTQLTFVNDEQYASVELIPPVFVTVPDDPPPCIIGPIHPFRPVPIDPPCLPMIHQLPKAGSFPVVTKAPAPPQIRDTGYQRPDRSGSTPTTTASGPDRRTSDPVRGRR